MKLSLYSYEYSKEKNKKSGFTWKQVLTATLYNVRKGYKQPTENLIKSYEDKEYANNLIDFIVNSSEKEFEEFKKAIYEINEKNQSKLNRLLNYL